MKSSKIFNNISNELRKEIPRLNSGETAVFQLTNGVPNPEPDEKERSKQPILYPKVQLMTKFRIYDKYKGEYVDVGCVESWNGEEPIAFRCFIPGKNNAGAFMSFFPGKFELKGGNVQDEELYEILWISPQRKGTPCPDASVEQIFELVDGKNEVKKANSSFEKLKKVIDILDKITPEKAKMVLAAVNHTSYQDPVTRIAKVKEWAKNNVDDFLAAYESPLTPIKDILQDAIVAGVLSFDSTTGNIKTGKTVVTSMNIADHADFLPEFARWISTSENGKDVLNNIKSQLSDKKVEA